ncbi:MAG: sugar-binding domain-containing protein [Segetibacter sp.]
MKDVSGISTQIMSLNGNDWRIAIDSNNVGRQNAWFKTSPVSRSKQTRVPWILQDIFPAYHGVAWYWRDFLAPKNNFSYGRTLLRFWSVDYMADVWLNNVFMGRYESGDVAFVIDVTDVVKSGGNNHLSIRVLNPTNEPIDSMTLKQILNKQG